MRLWRNGWTAADVVNKLVTSGSILVGFPFFHVAPQLMATNRWHGWGHFLSTYLRDQWKNCLVMGSLNLPIDMMDNEAIEAWIVDKWIPDEDGGVEGDDDGIEGDDITGYSVLYQVSPPSLCFSLACATFSRSHS